MKKVLIITSGQPAGNPRMTKEAVALYNAGCEVTVIYCPMSVWGDDFDKELFDLYPRIKWIRVGAHPFFNKHAYFYSRIRRKTWELFYKYFGNRINAALRAASLYSQDLENEALRHEADLYIGHNLGSIKAVLEASIKHGGLASFDFEDFYTGCLVTGSLDFRINQKIENKYLKRLKFATFASPLILQEYLKHYVFEETAVILNSFNLLKINNRINSGHSDLNLFWFSQNITKNRGIETILSALSLLQNKNIKLTLLGNLSEANSKYFDELIENFNLTKNQVVIHGPVHPDSLGEFASRFHIGICSEESDILNVNLCLANKIFTYVIGGNALILSNTKAHVHFLQAHPNIGLIYEQKNARSLSVILHKYFIDRQFLELHRFNINLMANNRLNWEIESSKLIDFYSNILNKN